MFSVCPHLGGGVPISHNALQHYPECHGAGGGGGYPARPRQGGYPVRGVPWWGGTQVGTPPWPGQDGGGTLPGGGGYPVRTT